MRYKVFIFALAGVLMLFFLVRSVFTLLTLLVEDASADVIQRVELNPTKIGTHPQKIPKIIHQTYKNETIPKAWRDAQQSCIDLHPDYEYILWTDDMTHEFIATNYPWFLNTFEGYKYPIQRADSMRYFVLLHYGGIYIDLDDGCNRRLDPLLIYPAWLHRTEPTGISNDAMGSIPQHPFFLKVTKMLPQYDRGWLLPYITVMYSTGPLFLSVMWKEYMWTKPAAEARVRVLMSAEYMDNPWSLFTSHGGSSWHRDDARLIFWMGSHWKLLTFCVTVIVCLLAFGLWLAYSQFFRWVSKNRYRYTKIPNLGPSPALVTPGLGLRPVIIGLLCFFRRRNKDTEGEDYPPVELGGLDGLHN